MCIPVKSEAIQSSWCSGRSIAWKFRVPVERVQFEVTLQLPVWLLKWQTFVLVSVAEFLSWRGRTESVTFPLIFENGGLLLPTASVLYPATSFCFVVCAFGVYTKVLVK